MSITELHTQIQIFVVTNFPWTQLIVNKWLLNTHRAEQSQLRYRFHDYSRLIVNTKVLQGSGSSISFQKKKNNHFRRKENLFDWLYNSHVTFHDETIPGKLTIARPYIFIYLHTHVYMLILACCVKKRDKGSISWILVSVNFTDKCTLSQSEARILVAYNYCQWKSLTTSFMEQSSVFDVTPMRWPIKYIQVNDHHSFPISYQNFM